MDTRCRRKYWLFAAVLVISLGSAGLLLAQFAEPQGPARAFVTDYRLQPPNGDAAQGDTDQQGDQAADAPTSSGLIDQPASISPTAPAPASSLAGELSSLAPTVTSSEVAGEARQATAQAPSANIISGLEASSRATTDAGSLLKESLRNPGVTVVQRNPIIGDPRIRGYHFGQYLASADGGFWYPARLDVDSIISKIDSRIINDVVIVNGPYSVRYGPAFAFIDIATLPTPRYEGRFHIDGTGTVDYNTNGARWYARETITGGGDDFGFVLHYSHLTGSDYESGGGFLVPSSYKSRNLNAAIGYDLSDETEVTFRYLRQDQTDVELAGQLTDIDFLVSDAFNLNIASREGGLNTSLLNVNGWYNNTRAQGSGGRVSKQSLFNSVFDMNGPFGLPSPPFPPEGSIPTLPRNSLSTFEVMSAGFTIAATWGEEERTQWTLGTDLRHYTTGLRETLFRPPLPADYPPFLPPLRSGTGNVVSSIPNSESTNPGIFADVVIPVTPFMRVSAGGRVDWVSVEAGPGGIPALVGELDVLGPDRDNSYTLGMGYVTSEVDLTDVWSANVGFGYSERPPTLTELYAMRPFESVLQQGLNRIQGNPQLDLARLKQVDIGVSADTGRFRGTIRGFHSWVGDYITSQGIAVDPTSSEARITSVFVNTPRATLAGGEAFGEFDATDSVTLFGTLMYVEGRNHTLNEFLFDVSGDMGAAQPGDTAPPGSSQGGFFGRDDHFYQMIGEEPLPQIPPLQSRLGVRLQDPNPNSAWAVEYSARIVDNQDRVARASLLERPTPGFTVHDIRGTWQPFEDVSFFFGVLNFTDKLYREHLDNRAGNQLFQPGTSGYVGVDIRH